MILLPMEIIDKILSYRETHPAAKLIKNIYDDYEGIINRYYTDSYIHHHEDYNCKYLLRYSRILYNWFVKIINDSENYNWSNWIIKHLDYNPGIPEMKNTYTVLFMKTSFISEIPVN